MIRPILLDIVHGECYFVGTNQELGAMRLSRLHDEVLAKAAEVTLLWPL
jgi:hypothetical protein